MPINTNRAAEAWSVTERGRARALLDLLARADRDLIEQARGRAQQAGDAELVAVLDGALRMEQQARVDLTTAEALIAATRKQRGRTEARNDLSEEEKSTRLAKLDGQLAEQDKSIKLKRRALA